MKFPSLGILHISVPKVKRPEDLQVGQDEVPEEVSTILVLEEDETFPQSRPRNK